MTEFHADSESIEKLGKMFGRLSEDANLAAKYVNDNGELKGGEGWLNEASGAHESIIADVQKWWSTLDEKVAAKTEVNIKDAVSHYQNTDNDNAERIDSSASEFEMQDSKKDPYGPDTGRTIFDDLCNPGNNCQKISDYSNHKDFKWNPEWTDFVSIASIARSATIEITGAMAWAGWIEKECDPYDDYTKPIVGDWAAMRACADMFKNLSAAADEVVTNLQAAKNAIPEVWSGNAAGACQTHIEKMIEIVKEGSDALDTIEEEYLDVTEAVADYKNLAESLLNEMIDAVMVAALAVAGGGSMAPETFGVSAIIGALIGGWEVWTIAKCIDELADLWSTMDTAVKTYKAIDSGSGRIVATGKAMPSLDSVVGKDAAIAELPS